MLLNPDPSSEIGYLKQTTSLVASIHVHNHSRNVTAVFLSRESPTFGYKQDSLGASIEGSRSIPIKMCPRISAVCKLLTSLTKQYRNWEYLGNLQQIVFCMS